MAFGSGSLTLRQVPVHYIPNERLRADKLPSPAAEWAEIDRFALTFDGYKHWGSFEQCAEIANAKRHDTLTDLRTCLFFEQRRWRHFGSAPDEEDMTYIHSVLVAGPRLCISCKRASCVISCHGCTPPVHFRGTSGCSGWARTFDFMSPRHHPRGHAAEP